MLRLLRISLGAFFSLALGSSLGFAAPPDRSSPLQKNLTSPLAFERQGSGDQTQYIARSQGSIIALDGKRAQIRVPRHGGKTAAFSFEFAGAHKSAARAGAELPGKVNYIHGNNPQQWKLGLPTFGRVSYESLYPGVDAVFYGNQRQLEFDLMLRPGADPKQIRLKFDGSRNLSVDEEGALVVRSGDDTLRLAVPSIYQEVNGQKRPVKGRYTLRASGEAGFSLDAYDLGKALVIDPTIAFSTLLGGGTGDSFAQAVAVDSAGYSYVAGYTYAQDFPLTNSSALLDGLVDAFVAKMDASGNLIYSTYVGGSGSDQLFGIAVDASGAAWVTGSTNSVDFPLVSAYQSSLGGTTDGVVMKLNALGNPVYSTYFGTSTQGNAVAVDLGGNAYIAGNAGTIPATPGAFQTSSVGSYGFIAKFTPQASLSYASYLGGVGGSYATSVAVDNMGSAYVAGYTFAPSFPGAPGGGAQTYNRGSNDAFVAKLNPTGSALLYFTFLGGSGSDFANSITLDSGLNAYISGGTTSPDFFVTIGALQTTYSGQPSSFLAKLNSSGSQLVYSTYLGSARPVYQYGLAVDSLGFAYVAGTTSDSLATPGAVQANLPNTSALFQSQNAGASWSIFDSGVPGTVTGVSTDPFNEGVMNVTTDSGIYRTSNNGSSWYKVASGNFVALSRCLSSPGVIYASTGTAVYVSNDDGVTFYTTENRAVSSAILLADPGTSSVAYAGTSGQPLSRTKDGGTTWTTLPTITGVNTYDSLIGGPDGTIYLSTNTGIFKSTDQGNSWTAINTGLASLTGVANGLAVSAANPSVLYRSSGSATIYATSNGGGNWSAVPGTLPFNVGALAVSPANASIIYALPTTTSANVFSNPYVSTDGGATWNPTGSGLGTSVLTNIVFDTGNPSVIYALAKPSKAGFLTKINPAGSAVVYFTSITGSISAQPNALAIGPTGDVYVAGTEQGVFPGSKTAPLAPTHNAFVTRVQDGTLPCSYTVQPGSQIIYSQAQTLSFVVTAPSGCPWTVSTDSSWTELTSPAASSGSDIVSMQITADSSILARNANLMIAGQAITITQAPSDCSYSVTPGSGTVPITGGSLQLNVTAIPGCPWSVSNPFPNAVTITSGGTGNGSGVVNVTVTPSTTTGPRNLSLAIGNTSFLILQSGICSYQLSSAGGPVSSASQISVFTVTAPAGCPWTAVSNQTWLTILSGNSGSGTGPVSYQLAANTTGVPRAGTITVGSQTFSVEQAAVGTCLFSVSATSASLGNGSGTFNSLTGSFTVNATNCTASDTWTATSDYSRLIITGGSGGTGANPSTAVSYMMPTNSTTLPHVGHITVSGLMSGLPFSVVYTVTQAGSIENQTQRVVRALYQTILGREPDPSGWLFWTGSGVMLNVMADDFYRSPEFQSSGFLVLTAYTTVLGRLPTYSEWMVATNQIRNQQLTALQLVNNLVGTMSVSTFVQTAIQNGLGRAATPNEINNYTAALSTGETAYDFLATVIFPDPAFQANTNPAFVAMLYYTILVRDYDTTGFNFWLGQATNPPGEGGIYYVFNTPAGPYATKLAILGNPVAPNPSQQGFLGSPEFQALIQ